MLFESASSSGGAVRRNDGMLRTLRQAAWEHYTAEWATVRTAARRRTELVRDYAQSRSDAIASHAKGPMRSVIWERDTQGRADSLVALLLANGIEVQDNGECLTFNGRYPIAIDSPIEQNRRHVRMLDRLFASGAIPLPKRMGFTLKPKLRNLVLIAEGRITRPKTPVAGIESLIRTDQLFAHIQRVNDSGNALDIAKLVSQDTLMAMGKAIVDMHRPIEFDWERRFRLSAPPVPQAPAAPKVVQLHPAPPSTPVPAMAAPRPPAGQCDDCQAALSSGVKTYCRKNHERFNGRVLCMNCQAKVPAKAG